MEIVGIILMLAGLFFFWVSALGLIRMPDFFTRMHAGTKATTLASLLMLAGLACYKPEWTLKLVILAVFILITNPLSSSVLARAAHRSGTDTCEMKVNACAERQKKQADSDTEDVQ